MDIRRGHFIIVLAGYALSFPSFAMDVLTYHNDNARTGLNASETTLTPKNVNASSFGLIRSLAVDGQVYAQPLYVSSAQVFSAGQSQGSHNLLIVATENDSVYAFDADSGTPYWKVSTLAANEVPSDSRGCSDLTPEVGITATPVIDRAMGPHGTIYVLAMSKTANSSNYYERLHALDLATGQDVLPSVTIQASYPGNGPGRDGKGQYFLTPATKERGPACCFSTGTFIPSGHRFVISRLTLDGSLLTTRRPSPKPLFSMTTRMACRPLPFFRGVREGESGKPDRQQL